MMLYTKAIFSRFVDHKKVTLSQDMVPIIHGINIGYNLQHQKTEEKDYPLQRGARVIQGICPVTDFKKKIFPGNLSC